MQQEDRYEIKIPKKMTNSHKSHIDTLSLSLYV
jgi:hypothetical protein